MRLLVGERQMFLDYGSSPSLKEFHQQREGINKLLSQTDLYLRRLI